MISAGRFSDSIPRQRSALLPFAGSGPLSEGKTQYQSATLNWRSQYLARDAFLLRCIRFRSCVSDSKLSTGLTAETTDRFRLNLNRALKEWSRHSLNRGRGWFWKLHRASNGHQDGFHAHSSLCLDLVLRRFVQSVGVFFNRF